jgi:3-oxoacyl-[acyl-carrier protein] reductase
MGNLPHSGKLALVTGGTRGIGLAICRNLAAGGARVFATYATDDQSAAELDQFLGESGRSIKLDAADYEQVEQRLRQLVKEEGAIGILVNNVGTTCDAPLGMLKEQDLQHALDINLKSAFATSRVACRKMITGRFGRIVNIVSVIGETGNAAQTAYAATKAGLIGFTKSLARELAGRNITVNAVSPGFIETEMTARMSEENRQKALALIPAGRFGTVDEVAAIVDFLCREQAAFITGEVIRVNGGMYI